MKPLPGTWSSGRWTSEERRLLNGRAREPEDPAGQSKALAFLSENLENLPGISL